MKFGSESGSAYELLLIQNITGDSERCEGIPIAPLEFKHIFNDFRLKRLCDGEHGKAYGVDEKFKTYFYEIHGTLRILTLEYESLCSEVKKSRMEDKRGGFGPSVETRGLIAMRDKLKLAIAKSKRELMKEYGFKTYSLARMDSI